MIQVSLVTDLSESPQPPVPPLPSTLFTQGAIIVISTFLITVN